MPISSQVFREVSHSPASPWLVGTVLRSPTDHARVLHEDGRGRVTIAQISPGQGYWREQSVPITDLAAVLSDFAGRTDCYLTQNRFWTRRRRIVDLAKLDALFTDLDYYKTEFADWTPSLVLQAALRALDDANLPAPSFAIASGRGVALTWLHSAAPRQALPRWRLCQQRIFEVLKRFGADPLATDAARVLRLVGTRNSKSGSIVEAITPAARPWLFDMLADEILPFTRAEIDTLRVERVKRSAAREAGVHNGRPTLVAFNAATLWQGRLDELERLLRHRWFGSLPPGHRDAWLFTAGIGASYLTPPSRLRRELFHLARRVACWSDHETGHRLQCVIQRAEAAARGERFDWHGNQIDPRYRMKDETIIRVLDITEQEMLDLNFRHLLTPELKRARERARWHGRRSAQERLSRDEYVAKSIERQKPWEFASISRATWYRRRT
jgi:hypothetical protein